MTGASPSAIKTEDHTPKTVKDKNCPYCGQAFTSSSLGRHLDLYIKERNPKRPDGIHDVDEIRRMRGGVTRRQPKGAARRQTTSTPSGTPAAASRNNSLIPVNGSSPVPMPSEPVRDDVGPASAVTSAADIASMFPLGGVRWETTGVINEVMAPSSEESGGGGDSGGPGSAGGEGGLPTVDLNNRGFNPSRRAVSSRVVSQQAAKPEPDMKQKLQDALDDARAAELALREFANVWRAAKAQIELGSMPLDFDPLTMNFPALILRCLRPLPTLFASTQLPTPSCWSTAPPGASQFEALKGYFREEFRKWRVKCAAATTALYEELEYPPPATYQHIDRQQALERAERTADALELEAGRHLEVAFQAWSELPYERQTELWVLELARGMASKQAEIDKLKEVQNDLRQETTNLRSHIEQLNRLQQPREFKLVQPAHIPMNERVLFEVQDAAVSRGRTGIGFHINDRHADLGTVVSSAISRWKSVILSARSTSSGASVQRAADTPAASSSALSPDAGCGSQGPSLPSESAAAPSIRLPRQPRRQQQRAASRVSSRATRGGTASRPGRTASTPFVPQPLPPPPPNQTRLPQPAEPPRSKESADGESAGNPKTPFAQPLTPGVASSRVSDGGAGEEEHDEEGDDDDDDDDEEGEEEEEDNDDDEDDDDDDDDDDQDDDKDDEMSEKDADAEMEDNDAFAHMHTPISRGLSLPGTAPPIPPPSLPPQQTATPLDVPRTRAAVQRHVLPSSGAASPGLLATSRSMPAASMAARQGSARVADVGFAVPSTGGGDMMYTD